MMLFLRSARQPPSFASVFPCSSDRVAHLSHLVSSSSREASVLIPYELTHHFPSRFSRAPSLLVEEPTSFLL
ncbi:hypothetical protein Csa_010554 [Cucumis sativus]|uniref:Uncharacterized protein n=1 Tax=Cucumis sativus TaxID=3659 RepID=A0A0A0LAC8_CUCSA|nr:hypothetical protein Csa_010554 [Cucumis sativus]